MINRAQRLLQMVKDDQPGVVCIDIDYVQLKVGAFLRTFKSYMARIDGDRHLRLEAYRDGVSYVTVVLAGEPEYAELKENAPIGLDSEQGAQTKPTAIE